MLSPAQFSGVAEARLRAGAVHLAIGMFDGVHRGHRATIAPAVRAARESGGVAAVLTFWPHPSVLFRPDAPTLLIQSPATKATVLGQVGIEAVITQPFDAAFAHIPAEEFLPWLKAALPELTAVYVGENFRFGRGRHGDVAVLRVSATRLGITVHVADPVLVGGQPVSSTRVRRALAAGEIAVANELLGYPYFADGTVQPGKSLGRTIGFPTLNLSWAPELRPKFGVYAVRIRGDEREGISAVANYGLRPTLEQATEPKLEVHVMGACPYDSGDVVVVDWLHFLRPEQKFASVDDLRAQIARDRDAATAALATS